mgnify:CR=1 FL=1
MSELFLQILQTLRGGFYLSAFASLLAKGAAPAGQFSLPMLDMIMFLKPLLNLGLRVLERGGLPFGAQADTVAKAARIM